MSTFERHLEVVSDSFVPYQRDGELPRVARINGIALPLGTMAIEELETLNGHTADRLDAALRDHQLVGEYLDLRTGFTPDDAA